MFGPISPKVKDLTQFQNTWTKDQIYKQPRQNYSGNSVLLNSPATIWEAQGWSTSGAGSSLPVAYKAYTQPVQGAPHFGRWKLQYSLNNATYSDSLTYDPKGTGGGSKALFTTHGFKKISHDNSSTVDTLLSLDISSSGSTNHIGMSFGSTVRTSFSSTSQGITEYKTAGSSPNHSFYTGGSIGSQGLIAQVFSNGFYNSYSNFNNGKVTAGSADQTVQTTLSTYGSFAAKGVLVTSSSYTLADTETFVYVDPSNSNFCVGTPTACNTYMIEATCNAHTGVGCSWSAGTSCGDANGTDSSTCTSGRSGCTWEEVSCSSADNTDQTTCEDQDNAFGGGCTWDTSTCPAFTTIATCDAEDGCTSDTSGDCTTANGGDQATCEALGDGTTCTWAGGDCHAFDSTDQATCESGHTGCTWDGGGNLCNGVYDEASVCSGNYFVGCSGSLCNGNYNTGNCTGFYGAGCIGSASCGNITSSGPCASESGCSWATGVTVTLPTTANASRGTTGRVYSIIHVGSTGTVSLAGQSGEPIFQYTTLSLLKKGDKVLLHNQNIAFPCSLITTESPCNAQTGCIWLVVCSTLGDQSSCEAAQCSWNGDTNVCEGRTTAVCSGTYDNGSRWYAHSLERGYSIVEKTANYTITDIDDMVVVTANSVTLTLPSASLNNGKEYVLKNFGSGTVTLATTSSQTIDGNGSGVLTLATGESMTVRSNNVNWYIK
jgi:hypothetical protein